jgi:ABC-type cobalamin transport system permease subunit
VAQKPDEKHAMRVVDMKSMNVIAPTKLISNHTKGVWWSVRYDRSLRLRLMGINSARASAVAFGLPGNLLKEDDKQMTNVS